MENTKTLSDLSSKYPLTDKGPLKADGTPGHNYTETYEIHFNPLRDSQVKILEIGFGGGDSLKLWTDYFERCDVYCIDNDLARIEEYGYTPHDRIKIFQGDQSSEYSLLDACQKIGVDKFDIIIDDGSHIGDHIMTTFNTLFEKYLKPGGVYFIEDYPNTLNFISSNIESIGYNNELTTIKKINDGIHNFKRD
jgi:demethylmacrocin O-methyltransferase